MPHLAILSTPDVEADTDLSALCRTLTNTISEAARCKHSNLHPLFNKS